MNSPLHVISCTLLSVVGYDSAFCLTAVFILLVPNLEIGNHEKRTKQVTWVP
jgi:hypothetical protein